MPHICKKLLIASSSFLHYHHNNSLLYNVSMTFRERVLFAMKQKPGCNPRKLSIEAGLSDSMMHKFLSGQTDSMTISNAEKLANALDVDFGWLASGEGQRDKFSEIDSILKRMTEEEVEKATIILRALAA